MAKPHRTNKTNPFRCVCIVVQSTDKDLLATKRKESNAHNGFYYYNSYGVPIILRFAG